MTTTLHDAGDSRFDLLRRGDPVEPLDNGAGAIDEEDPGLTRAVPLSHRIGQDLIARILEDLDVDKLNRVAVSRTDVQQDAKLGRTRLAQTVPGCREQDHRRLAGCQHLVEA